MKRIVLLLLAGLFFNGLFFRQEKKLDNVFYCFYDGISTLPNAPKTLDTLAALIKKITYFHIEYLECSFISVKG